MASALLTEPPPQPEEFFFKGLLFSLMCMRFGCVYVGALRACLVPTESREGTGSLELVMRSCEPPYGYRKWSLTSA